MLPPSLYLVQAWASGVIPGAMANLIFTSSLYVDMYANQDQSSLNGPMWNTFLTEKHHHSNYLAKWKQGHLWNHTVFLQSLGQSGGRGYIDVVSRDHHPSIYMLDRGLPQ